MNQITIDLLEQFLGVKFPKYYKEFILQKGSEIIDGYEIMGLPTKEVPMSVLEGALILREKRDDLPNNLTPVCLKGTKALCLDLAEGNTEDAPLVEVDLTKKDFVEPIPLSKTFVEWIEEHDAFSKRFPIAWNRVMSRHKEKGSRVTNWKTVIARVKDYIVGLGKFRLDYKQGCLEVDEFYPIDQPHVPRGTGIKVLLSEMFSRGRDYSGSLEITFTMDPRENENGLIPATYINQFVDRKPRAVPGELVAFAREKYGIEFKEAEKGRISRAEGVSLWFAALDIPREVVEKIKELVDAGYVNREIVAELVAREIWTKEEVVWIFLNAPRPEALLFGTDLPEQRLYYSESLGWGRAALLATRFKDAIMAELTEGASIEEIEKKNVTIYLEPEKDFWLLRCSREFNIPKSWMMYKFEVDVKTNEPVLLLSRPRMCGNLEQNNLWIEEQIRLLKNSKAEVKIRCLLLNSEFIDSLTQNIIFGVEKAKAALNNIYHLAEEAAKEGIYLLFTPTRTYIFLDEEIQNRMRRARRMVRFPSRGGPLKLQVITVPNEYWDVSDKNATRRTFQIASESAQAFAEQIAKKSDLNRYRIEFSDECEVIEREALCGGFPTIVDIEGKDSEDLIESLKRESKDGSYITFPFVSSSGMPRLLEKIEGKGNRRLVSQLSKISGGIVILVKPYEPLPAPIPKRPITIGKPFIMTEEMKQKIDSRVMNKRCVNGRWEIMRTHELLRKSIESGVPLSLASIRSHTLVEVMRDYIYGNVKNGEANLRMAYGDGAEGRPFPLFSLNEIERPSGNLFKYPVGFVSLRHMDADRFTERSLVRNIAIQHKEDSTDQEDLAFRKTYECIEEFLRFLNKEIHEEDSSLSLKSLLTRNAILKERDFNVLWVHIFHTTALEPAAVGVYRAVLEMIKKYRGQLIVVPRILRPSAKDKPYHATEDYDYGSADEWF